MMQKIIVARLIAAASLFLSPIAASATTATSQSTDASASNTKTAAAIGEKKICKQLPSSSSRLPQRVCLTEKQWKQVDADSE
jgi:hypothetical protein